MRPRSRAPATPAKTASRFRRARRPPNACGTPCCRPAATRAWCRPDSAPATRFGSKRRCGCTATTWTKRRRCVEADLGWIVGWKKDGFIGCRRPAQAEGRGRSAQARGLRDARARHRPSRLRRVSRRREGRRRDQRNADAVLEEGHRHGVSAGRPRAARARSSRSTSAAAARRPASSRCRSTSDRSSRSMGISMFEPASNCGILREIVRRDQTGATCIRRT